MTRSRSVGGDIVDLVEQTRPVVPTLLSPPSPPSSPSSSDSNNHHNASDVLFYSINDDIESVIEGNRNNLLAFATSMNSGVNSNVTSGVLAGEGVVERYQATLAAVPTVPRTTGTTGITTGTITGPTTTTIASPIEQHQAALLWVQQKNVALTTELTRMQHERKDTMRRMLELERFCEHLQTTNRDVVAEREVYRFELSNYKEAVLTLRASGCRPPRVALVPTLPGWGSQSSPVSLQPAHEFDDSSDPSGSFAIGAFGASLGPHRHALSRLNQAIVEFVDMVEQDSQRRLLAKMQALRHVKAAVNALWPRAQVKVFGSFVTGLQLPSSDLDVVICLPNVRRVINHQWAIASKGGTLEGTDAIKETWQEQLTRRLQRCPWVLPDTLSKQGTAMPIISLATRPLGGQGLSGDSFR